MTTNIKESEWIPWLQRFGERLQSCPETYGEIAQRLVQFGQLHRGELGKVAERIEGHPYPVAFTHTQNWLKGVTKEDLSQWYQQQIDELEQKTEFSDGDIRCRDYFEACRDGLATIKENPPFAHPYHWSPFTLYEL